MIYEHTLQADTAIDLGNVIWLMNAFSDPFLAARIFKVKALEVEHLGLEKAIKFLYVAQPQHLQQDITEYIFQHNDFQLNCPLPYLVNAKFYFGLVHRLITTVRLEDAGCPCSRLLGKAAARKLRSFEQSELEQFKQIQSLTIFLQDDGTHFFEYFHGRPGNQLPPIAKIIRICAVNLRSKALDLRSMSPATNSQYPSINLSKSFV